MKAYRNLLTRIVIVIMIVFLSAGVSCAADEILRSLTFSDGDVPFYGVPVISGSTMYGALQGA